MFNSLSPYSSDFATLSGIHGNGSQKNVYCEEFCVFQFQTSSQHVIQKLYHVPHILLFTYHFTCLHASDKKAIRKIFKDCFKLGIEYHDIDSHIQELTKTLAIKYIDDHFINKFLSQCPSGRYRAFKYRGERGQRQFFYATLCIL